MGVKSRFFQCKGYSYFRNNFFPFFHKPCSELTNFYFLQHIFFQILLFSKVGSFSLNLGKFFLFMLRSISPFSTVSWDFYKTTVTSAAPQDQCGNGWRIWTRDFCRSTNEPKFNSNYILWHIYLFIISSYTSIFQTL